MSLLTTLTVTEDGFAFDTNTGESYKINPCGRLVIQRLKKGENRQQIANFLSNNFGIPQSTAERDISDFFQQLHSLGLSGVNQ